MINQNLLLHCCLCNVDMFIDSRIFCVFLCFFGGGGVGWLLPHMMNDQPNFVASLFV